MKQPLDREKWTRLTGETINSDGADALAAAIVLKAAEDYWYVCDQPNKPAPKVNNCDVTQTCLKTRHMLEKFFNSDYFGIICPIDKDRFMNTIRRYKKNGQRLPTMYDINQNRKGAHYG